MSKLRAGVIGCGTIGTWAHLPSLSKMDDVELVAVCDLVEEKGRNAAEKFGAGRFYLDAAEMLEKEKLDFVVIATPPNTHAELTLAALERGVNVFLEKPIAHNMEDALKIKKAAEESGLKVALGFCLRFHAMFRYVKELIDSGYIGKPLFMWRFTMSGYIFNPLQKWLPSKSASGGMIVENSIHFFDVFRWYAGEYEEVFAYLDNFSGVGDIEDAAIVSMKFKSGARANLVQLWSASHSTSNWGVVGSEGAVSVDGYLEGKMKVSRRGEALRIVEIKEDAHVMYYKELRSFIESIRSGKPVFAGVEDGIKALEAALAAHKSVETGAPVKL